MNIDRDKLIEMAKEAGFKVNNFTVGGKEHFEICAIGTTCKVEITKFASLVSAHAITAMQTELDAAKEEADQNKRLFLQACQTLGKCGELLGIPEDETTGEPFELYDAIEQLQERVTSMQGDSEPVGYISEMALADFTWHKHRFNDSMMRGIFNNKYQENTIPLYTHHKLGYAVADVIGKLDEIIDVADEVEVNDFLHKAIPIDLWHELTEALENMPARAESFTSIQAEQPVTREEIINIAEKAGAYVGGNYPQLIEGNHQVKVFEYTKKVIELVRYTNIDGWVLTLIDDDENRTYKFQSEKNALNAQQDWLEQCIKSTIQPAPVTSMQGDSEPTAYMSRKKMTDLAISMLPTKYARESKQSEGWSEWKPASIKDFEQHQQSIGKSDWMHDVEFIELFTHDRVKGVSDERVEFEVLFNKIKDLPRASFLLNSSGGVAKYLDKSGNWIEHYEVIKLLDQYLENLSQLSTNTDGWVSVSDRLPNDGDEVIGYGIWEGEIAGKSDGKSVEAGTWRNGEIQLSSDYYSVNLTDVTHWQPLPSPPINAISQDKGESV